MTIETSTGHGRNADSAAILAQRIGGISVIAAGLGDIAILLLLLIVLPGMGFHVPDDFNNSTQTAAFASTLSLLSWIDILFGLVSVPTMLGLYERMRSGGTNRMRLALAGGVAASSLFLAAGIVGLTSGILGTQNSLAVPVINALTQGLEDAGIFAIGTAFLLSGWAALTTQSVPRLLSYLMMLAGVLAMLFFLSPLVSLLETAAYIVTTLWLGATLLRSPRII